MYVYKTMSWRRHLHFYFCVDMYDYGNVCGHDFVRVYECVHDYVCIYVHLYGSV